MGRTSPHNTARWALGAAALASALAPLAAMAQSASSGPIRNQPYPAQGPYPQTQGATDAPPPEPGPPPGYDGRQLPPPPPGYAPGPESADQRAADERYAWEAERWARENCVRPHANIGGGLLAGGLLGAIIGSGLGGRHDHGGGAALGAIIGAGAGAAVASGSGGETSPGCPPGYVLRRGAPAYAYAAPDYAYGAPGWYRPWVFYDGFWGYRPYPYHAWYWRTYRGPAWRGGYGGNWGHGDGDYGHGWGHQHRH